MSSNVSYSGGSQRILGAYYTTENPFTFAPFQNWLSAIPLDNWLEPFAGSGNIPRMLEEIGVSPEWSLFDVDQTIDGVVHRDTLTSFPSGHRVAISNPPYLSYHFAKRKGLQIDKSYFRGYSSLYLVAIEECLKNCDFVALIVPESFMTTELFRGRLSHFVSLPFRMFGDTEMPVALVLFTNVDSPDFEIWRGDMFVGLHSKLPGRVPESPYSECFKFNVPDGQIGLRAIDNSINSSIRFLPAVEVPVEKVKHSARLVTRIHYNGAHSVEDVIREANLMLSEWRLSTSDIHLTAFKGVRSDGMFRRRLDYVNARHLLGQAVSRLSGDESLF